MADILAGALATWGGWAPAIRDDPFGHFAEARARCPVQRVRLADGHPAWVVLGYDAARQALNDPRMSKDMLAALRDNSDVVAEGLPGPEFSRHMLNVDPPDHTRLRRLVSRAFTPARVAALEPAVRAIAGRLLDELAAAGPDATVDLIEGYAYPLPFGVIGELLGIPAADRPRLHAWFQVLLTGWAGDPPAGAVEASDGIMSCLRELAEPSGGGRAMTWSASWSPSKTTCSPRKSCCRPCSSWWSPVMTPRPASSATASWPCSSTRASSRRCSPIQGGFPPRSTSSSGSPPRSLTPRSG
jgi:cytochrome P450